jgi:hypothetical protein
MLGTAMGLPSTNTHRVEVEVGADGPASATLSGAAAAAPPAGASKLSKRLLEASWVMWGGLCNFFCFHMHGKVLFYISCKFSFMFDRRLFELTISKKSQDMSC